MKLLVLYWSMLLIGYVAGWRMRKREVSAAAVPELMTLAIYVLCLIMGLRMGADPQVTGNLGTIGVKALVATVFCIAGSMLSIFVVRKILHMDRYGNLKGKTKEEELPVRREEGGKSGSDLKITLIIVATVAAGMLIGAFGIASMEQGNIETFDSVSGDLLVICLCILMGFVGMDLGFSGTVIQNIRKAGWRVICFPPAAVAGSLILGSLACMFMGFSLREGLAISAGFGWYTYAPAVISGAGQQYAIAGAVSFVHNVIRETAGIVFIPLAARKIGYLESTGIPGVAAMDVCVPIVGRSCREDTIVYSFATGLFMCLVTSVGVPLIMGI